MNRVVSKLEREIKDAFSNIEHMNKILKVTDIHHKLRKRIKYNRNQSVKYYMQLDRAINILNNESI